MIYSDSVLIFGPGQEYVYMLTCKAQRVFSFNKSEKFEKNENLNACYKNSNNKLEQLVCYASLIA